MRNRVPQQDLDRGKKETGGQKRWRKPTSKYHAYSPVVYRGLYCPKVIKKNFMLNSAEHEIFPAHKY